MHSGDALLLRCSAGCGTPRKKKWGHC
jgi:hypothetical protein